MPVCKKINLNTDILLMSCFFICMYSLPVLSHAQTPGIMVNDINGSVNSTMLNINANITYNLSKDMREALDHGVPLVFDIIIRIKKTRDFFWDETIISKTISHKIEYQPLSRQYLVTEIHNGNIKQFRNLEEVLGYIGKLSEYPIIGSDMISTHYQYIVQIKSQLKIQELPAPLRPLAYFSPQWRLASPWQSWVIQL